MIANWKSLAMLLIGVAAMVLLGPRNDSGRLGAAQQVSDVTCGFGTPSGRCMVSIRYTYPLADLLVVPDDAYF